MAPVVMRKTNLRAMIIVLTGYLLAKVAQEPRRRSGVAASCH
jgi:hypothetical protein